MKIYLPLLFLAFAFYGSVPLTFSYFSTELRIKKYLFLFVAFNIIGLFIISFLQNWQLGAKLVFWDSVFVFIVCMSFLSVGMPLHTPFKSNAFKLLALNFLTILFIVVSFFFLSLTRYWHFFTRDPLLYWADLSLGFDPVAWTMQHLNHALISICNIIYLAIPFAFLCVCAKFYAKYQKLPNTLIMKCLLAAVLAWCLFNVIPAAGPAYAFPNDWWRAHAALNPSLLLAIPGDAPRNCLPSLHAAWAYLIWEFSHQFLSRRFSFMIFVWLVLTLIGTITTGEHYFIDVLLGVDFALAISAFYERRYLFFLCASSLYVGYMAFLIKNF